MNIWFGYDLQVKSAPILQPLKLSFWDPETYQKFQPETPFLYKADALVGLSLFLLNKKMPWPNPQATGKREFARSVWNELEPHYEMYLRAQNRIQALRANQPNAPSAKTSTSFETELRAQIQKSLLPNGIDYVELESLIETLEFLEANSKKNLLFNFDLRFSTEMKEELLFLYSLLFHTRNLMVMDYNSQIQDPSHEALKVDSISDYLPHADYLANDAVLFCALRNRNITGLRSLFHQHSNSGAVLIENLPTEFLENIDENDLAEALYLVQMDWLFGTESGLLYRIREELYGLRHGFAQIFYRDLEDSKPQNAHTLSANFQILATDLFPTSKVA